MECTEWLKCSLVLQECCTRLKQHWMLLVWLRSTDEALCDTPVVVAHMCTAATPLQALLTMIP